MQVKRADRQLLVLLGIGLCVAALWWVVGRSGATEPQGSGASSQTTTGARSPTPSRTTTPGPAPRPSGTPVSGLVTIAESALPVQAQETLTLIRAGGPYPHDEDGGTFLNRERILPRHARGYYREFTVETPRSADRGARRIIAGDDGDLYYTSDHYASFRQIEEGR